MKITKEMRDKLKSYRKLFNPVDNFSHFLLQDNPNYMQAAHNLYISQKLMELERGDINRLILCTPPRHGKSHLVSRFAAWYFMKRPNEEVLLTSYSSKLAGKFSRAARRAVKDIGHVFKVRLSQEKSGVEEWELEDKRGIFCATSIGGQITGRGANLCIIDDPIKNSEEAFSRAIKDKIWDWWDSTLKTRLYENSKVVLVLTKWAVDDLAGRIKAAMEKGEEQEWQEIKFPAIAEKDDPLGRYPGEALWPDNFSIEHLNGVKKSMSSYFWTALYQQSPRPEEGNFKYEWLRFYHPAEYEPGEYFRDERISYTLSSCDPAISEKQTADYSAILTADVTEKNNIILRDIWRSRVNFPSQLKQVVAKYQCYKPRAFIVEEVGFQRAIRQALTAEGHFIPFHPLKQTKNKFLRINAISPHFENGRIFIREDMKDFINEYLDFPSGHDDILDALEMIVSYVSGHYVGDNRITSGSPYKAKNILEGYDSGIMSRGRSVSSIVKRYF